ncbi:hypothetical protein MY10362_006873 [Beauveria mimosiformis]
MAPKKNWLLSTQAPFKFSSNSVDDVADNQSENNEVGVKLETERNWNWNCSHQSPKPKSMSKNLLTAKRCRTGRYLDKDKDKDRISGESKLCTGNNYISGIFSQPRTGPSRELDKGAGLREGLHQDLLRSNDHQR